MATPFADIEAMVNGGCDALLANATLAYIDETGDLSIDGVLRDSRNEPDAIGAPRGVREITFSFYATDLGCLTAGRHVVIRETDYAIARIESDKTGWVTLHLRGGVDAGGSTGATGGGTTGSTFGRHGNRRGNGSA